MVEATPYDGAFFRLQAQGSLESAGIIVPLVLGLVQVRSVIDVGCGVGTWLKAFQSNGVEATLGLDGDYVDRSRLLIPPSDFRPVNLEGPLAMDDAADLAVCLEVGEHLREQHADSLVDSLTKLAPFVLFSAAIPGQGGTHHVNEQWPEYWEALFAKRGYVCLDPIRPHIWQNPRVEWFYRQNIFVYAKQSHVDSDEKLNKFRISHQENDLMLVGRHALRGYMDPPLRRAANQFVHSLWGAGRRRLPHFGS